MVAMAIAAGLRVDSLAKVPFSFPIYAGIFGASRLRHRQAGLPGVQDGENEGMTGRGYVFG
jgi:hypothetical protein